MFESMELALPRQLSGEEEEVRRAKLGDEETWASWFDRYYPLLYRYVLARLGHREEAEDVASEVFTKALQGIGRYDYRGRPVLAWLYRIAHNLIADRARRGKRRPAVSLDDALARELEAPDVGLPRVELVDALQRLNGDQRDVLVLRFMVALSTREVGALLGKSDASVNSLQARGLQNLRRALKVEPSSR